MDVRDYFVDRLKEALKEKDLTQNELAKRTGISPSYISQLIQGKKLPQLKLLQKLQMR